MTWKNPFPETETDLLGVRISRLTLAQLLFCFETALDVEGPTHFAYLNIAVSNQIADNPRLGGIFDRAELVYVDGSGIRLGCRILGKDCPPRNTGADFLFDVLGLCARRGKHVGFLGGTPGSAEKVRKLARDRFPDLRVTFVCDGYGGLADESHWRPFLETDPPDLLLVGLGVPRQEEWIEKSRNLFSVRLYWSVGALFEYYGGGLNRCPRWLGRAGGEWLYRLYSEPRRLWKRYLIGNPRFLLRCLSSRWRGHGGTS